MSYSVLKETIGSTWDARRAEALDVFYQVSHPLRFRGDDRVSQTRQSIVSTSLVVTVRCGAVLGLLDQTLVEQALEVSVEWSRLETDAAFGTLANPLHDGVAVALLLG